MYVPGEQDPGGHGGGLQGEPLHQQLLHTGEVGPLQFAQEGLQSVAGLVDGQVQPIQALKVGTRSRQWSSSSPALCSCVWLCRARFSHCFQYQSGTTSSIHCSMPIPSAR